MNKTYAFPIIWGLGFLGLRHFSGGGDIYIGTAAAVGLIAVTLAATLRGKTSKKVW